MPGNQSYWFVFTRFGASDADLPTTSLYEILISDGYAAYIAWGDETAPSTGKKHHQGFIRLQKKSTTFAVRKKLGCWADPVRGRIEDNEAYCKKEGSFHELGTKPKQGTRTDITQYCEKVRAGELSVDDILDIDPQAFHQFGRTLQATEDKYLRSQTRTWMTKGIWYWGPTGCGKSHRALADYHPSTHYSVPLEDKGWWDSYVGQETVVLDDFRGSISYSTILRMVDKYPWSVPRRGRPPMPFLGKCVIITSAMPPDKVYHNLAEHDSLDQLYRRFEVVDLSAHAP